VREALLFDPDSPPQWTRKSQNDQPPYNDAAYGEDIVAVDGWLKDWEKIGKGRWETFDRWAPVEDETGKPLAERPSADDLSAQWRVYADSEALSVAVRARDDVNAPARHGDCPWLGDSVEVALRGEGRRYDLPTFTISPGGVRQNWAAGPMPPDLPAAVRYDPVSGWMIYEIAFPWAWLKSIGIEPGRPSPDIWELGFAVAVQDDDGRGLEGSLEWGGNLAEEWRPATWRVLRFSVF
jgi:hypothetical protein